MRVTIISVTVITMALFVCLAQGQQYQVLHQFLAKPAFPYAGLIQGSDGNFYGTTEQGGAAGVGTVFKITSAGNLTILHSFNGSDGAHPEAGLAQGSDGNFYGTTLEQGANTLGTIFKITPSGTFTTLHQFTGLMGDGANPTAPPIQASDGNFYGTTYFGGTSNQGAVFRMDSSGNVTTVHSFAGSDGSHPEAALVQGSDGNFYGTTALGGAGTLNGVTGGNGTVFKMTPSGVLTTLYSFAVTDGENPLSGLIEGSDGSFYGTTWQGGPGVSTTNTTGNGTVFKITPSGTLTTLHFFTGMPIDGANPQAALIRGTDGNFYGISENGGMNNHGAVFKMDSSGNVTILHSFAGSSDGSSPLHAPLIQASDGNFYGTAFAGGPFNSGSVFKMDPFGSLTVLHFFGGNDGSQPYAPIIQGRDGNFYGTTYSGGTNGNGTVFKMDSSGNTTVLHSFAGSDGANPTNLIQGSDGNFYGATFDGGGTNNGTVFKMDPSGNVTTLHSFTGLPVSGVLPSTEGALPFGPLVQGSDGNFYGTTALGGTSNDGTVFKITPSGSFTTLHSFSGSDGSNINCGLIQGSDGNFYGTTTNGGATSSTGGSAGLGTVFKMDSAGNVTTLHSFVGSDGSLPVAGLIQVSDGNFYGTTDSGGSSNNGTVFKMNSSGNVTTLHSFSGGDGTDAVAALIQGSDGNFYSTTLRGGSTNNGTVFKVTLSGALTTLHSFDGNDGAHPYGGLVQGSDGNFYGATLNGGPSQIGVVFRIGTPAPVQLTSVVSRKIHGSAGTFDIDLPLTGMRGVECRSGGANSDYTMVFTFLNPVTNCGAANTGSLSSGPNPNQCTVNLTGVPNAQYITVTLTGAVDSTGATGNVSGTMGVLVGDVNASGIVTSGDTNLCKAQALQPVTNANFRNDINASGAITTGDVNIIKQNALSQLPSPP